MTVIVDQTLETNVVFAGGGGPNPTVVMLDRCTTADAPRTVSAFPAGYSVYALAVSPGGRRLATGTRAGLLRVHALERYRARESATPDFEVFHGSDLDSGVLGLAFLTDEILASGGTDGCIRIWNTRQNRRLGEIQAHAGGVAALCALGSLVLASIGMDGVLRVWDLDTLTAKFESEPFALPGIAALTGLDFDPQSGRLFHASRSGRLYTYDTRNDFDAQSIEAHRGEFCAVACGFGRIATAGLADRTLKLWPEALDQPVMEATVAVPVVAMGWLGPGMLLTIGQDGNGQLRDVDGELRGSGPAIEGNLRTCVGLPQRLVSESRVKAARQWRDEKLAEANALLSQSDPDTRQRILDIVDELQTNGFAVEASLLLADAARADNRLLWELEARLALAEQLGDGEAAIPTLRAIAELLERVQEPARAITYLEKIAARGEDRAEVRERITLLRAHPLTTASPEDWVRGDLGRGELIPQELDKYTVIKNKFRWRVIFDTQAAATEAIAVEPAELLVAARAELAERENLAKSVDLVRVTLLRNRHQSNLDWLYVCCGDAHEGLAYAMEIRAQHDSVRLTPHAVFDASRVRVPAASSVAEHNESIGKAWARIAATDAKRWLAAVHERVTAGIRRVVACVDDGW